MERYSRRPSSWVLFIPYPSGNPSPPLWVVQVQGMDTVTYEQGAGLKGKIMIIMIIKVLLLDCKTVRIFSYSSKREQSNKRSGTRLKTESETERLARFARVTLVRHALPISLLILRKKPTVLQSILLLDVVWPSSNQNMTVRVLLENSSFII